MLLIRQLTLSSTPPRSVRTLLTGRCLTTALKDALSLNEVQANTLVIYKPKENDPTTWHIGVVTSNENGITMVESKWGGGALYSHPLMQVPSEYLKNPEDRPPQSTFATGTFNGVFLNRVK